MCEVHARVCHVFALQMFVWSERVRSVLIFRTIKTQSGSAMLQTSKSSHVT